MYIKEEFLLLSGYNNVQPRISLFDGRVKTLGCLILH